MESLPPIPTPPAQRWREFRIQILPIIVFVGIIAAIAVMWKNFVQPSGVVGEVEAVKANVISLQDGVIAELHVDRLQYVTNGQVIGKIVGTDPEVMRATLVRAQSELNLLRARMRLDEKRNEQNFQQLYMDLLNEKLARELAQVNWILATNTAHRAKQLYDLGVENEVVYQIERAKVDTFATEVVLRTKTIEEREQALKQFQEEAKAMNNDPIVADAIKAQEEELEQTLKPTNIRAPMTGVVSAIYRRTDERVVRGEPILTIAATMAERIVGYIRQPVQIIPSENDVVVIRTRTQKRQVGEGQILKVGAQFEAINPALLSADSNRVEMGLPILVSLPKGMAVSPGEFVDLSIRYAKR